MSVCKPSFACANFGRVLCGAFRPPQRPESSLVLTHLHNGQKTVGRPWGTCCCNGRGTKTAFDFFGFALSRPQLRKLPSEAD